MNIKYDVFNRAEPAEIYIAKPGQRIIGYLPGVREETAYLEFNLNNTNTLDIEVDRDIGGDVNPFYDYVERHYELYVKPYGWFKIKEEPEITNDGEVETKHVYAESLEIELQQYDLFSFKINTGEVDSWEMLATDNTYPMDEFTMFREQVRFYRDTTNLQALSKAFKDGNKSTVEDLEAMLPDYPQILGSWRINFDYTTIDTAIQSGADELRDKGEPYAGLLARKGHVKDKDTAMLVIGDYPVLLKYIDIIVDQKDAFDESITYTIQEIIDRETARQNQLSFLYLVLHEHGWDVGYVDTYTDPTSEQTADRELLKDRIGKFSVDNQDIYSFLTQDAAQYYRCIFFFDTDNYKVNAYKVESIGEDTNIILNFHNIQNEVHRSSEKELFTKFTVEGDDSLDFKEANFGQDWIEDLSYFMTTAHFPQSMIDKYEAWEDRKDELRPQYIQLSKDYRNQLAVVEEIYYRVPVDSSDTDQYDTFSEAELINEVANMNAQIAGYESLYVDEWGRFDPEIMRQESPSDYSNYYMIQNQVIPNIQIALYNRGVSSYDDEREYLDGYKYDFDTYGDSYGVAELQHQMTMLTNSIDTLGRRGYDHPGATGDEYAAEQYALYQKYVAARASCQRALAAREEEHEQAQDALNDIVDEMNAMRNEILIDNAQYGFTEEELWLLDKYYIHTDYVNENIVVTDQDSNEKIVDQEYELYLDAIDQLYVESHPQYTWTTSQDNLLLMPEFKAWHEPLELGNYVRVTLREDDIPIGDLNRAGRFGFARDDVDHSLTVKLRVSRIGINPFLLEQTIDLDFTNMVTYRSKRNDLADLLSGSNGSSKGSITSNAATTTSRDLVNVDSALVMKLINNGTFASYISSYMGSSASQAISATNGTIASTVATQIREADVYIDQLQGTSAEFQQVFADRIGADYVITNLLTAQAASISQLSSEVIRVGTTNITEIANGVITTAEIDVGQITGDTADFKDLFSERIGAQTVITEIIEADDATVGNLAARVITVGEDAVTQIANGVISTAEINVGKITGTEGEFETFFSNYINSDYITTQIVDASAANIGQITAAIIKADNATLRSVVADVVNAGQGLFFNLTSENTTMDNALIQNVIAANISVDDLQAGDITLSNNMRILSENGMMIMNGTALQIMGEDGEGNPYVGVQLGYDTNSDPSLILRNSEGATILTPSGITSDAIADQLIVNDMVHDGTLMQTKMGFNVATANADGTVSITNIKDGSGGNFGATYATFVSDTNNSISAVELDVDGLQQEITTKVSSTTYSTDMQTINTNISTISQKADKIDLVVANGSSSTNLNLTPLAMDAISTFINLNGVVQFSGLSDQAVAALTHGNLIVYEDSQANLLTDEEDPMQTEQGEQIIAEDICSLTFAAEDGGDGWVYFMNGKVTIPRFTADIYLDKFPQMTGYIVYRQATTEDVINSQSAWEQGGIDSTGAETQVVTYVRTTNMSPITSGEEYLIATSNCEYTIHEYDSNGDHIGTGTVTDSMYTPSSTATQIRLTLNYPGGAQIDITDIGAVYNVTLSHILINGAPYVVWKTTEGTTPSWHYMKIQGDENVYNWVWVSNTDVVLAEWTKDKYAHVSYTMFYPSRTREDIRTTEFLTNIAYQNAITDYTTINGGLIQTHTVVADSLFVETLSSITAAIGELTSGVIRSSNYNYTSGKFANSGMKLDFDHATISSKNFSIDASGNVYIVGDVTATSGTFTGKVEASDGYIGPWTIDNKSIHKGSAVWGTSGGKYFGDDGLSVSNTFKVTSDGVLSATGASVSGTITTNNITATGGMIGGINLNSSALYTNSKTTPTSTNSGFLISSSGGIYLGSYNSSTGACPFQVTPAGALTSTSGTIGGLAIDATSIHTNGVAITSNAANSVGLSSADFTRTINGTSRSGLRLAVGSNFGVSNTGVLYAGGAIISGTITATSGTIGGITANSSYGLYTNSKTSATSGQTGFFIDKNGAIYLGEYDSEVGSCPFQVTHKGILTARAGTVGGFTLGINTISKTTSVVSGYEYQLLIYAPDTVTNLGDVAYAIRKRTNSSGTYGSWEYPFWVNYEGKLTCTNVNIRGTINATDGSMGGFALESDSIHTSGVAVTSNADASIALSSKNFTRSINGTNRSLRFAIGSNFGVTSNGTLYAANATLAGSVTATTGKIGGFSINSTSIYGTFQMSTGGTTFTGTFMPSGIDFSGGNYTTTLSVDGLSLENSNGNWTEIQRGWMSVGTYAGGWSGSTQNAALSVYAYNGTAASGRFLCGLLTEAYGGAYAIGTLGDTFRIAYSDNFNDGVGKQWIFEPDNGNFTVQNGMVYFLDFTDTLRPAVPSLSTDGSRCLYLGTDSSNRLSVGGNYGAAGSVSTRYIATTTSDIRLKEAVADTTETALPVVEQMKLRQFDWKSNGEHKSIGFIADELEEINPELVFGGGEDQQGNLVAKGIDTLELIAYLTKAIQEQQAQIEELKRRIS